MMRLRTAVLGGLICGGLAALICGVVFIVASFSMLHWAQPDWPVIRGAISAFFFVGFITGAFSDDH